MNHCSWSCSYCHELIRNSSIPFPDIRDCYRLVSDISNKISARSQKINFNFTGGEVTEWNEFPGLVDHCDSLGHYVKFRTNASTDYATWIYLCEKTDEIILEIHPEYTLISKFFLMLDIAIKKSVAVNVIVNMDGSRWTELINLCSIISSKYPAVNIFKKMLFEDPVRNTKPIDYSSEQITELKRQSGDLILENDRGQKEFTDYQTLVLESKNRFLDYSCGAGVEQLVIDAHGNIYRGHCRMGGRIGHLTYDEHNLPLDTVICKKEMCVNSFDIHATKSTLPN